MHVSGPFSERIHLQRLVDVRQLSRWHKNTEFFGINLTIATRTHETGRLDTRCPTFSRMTGGSQKGKIHQLSILSLYSTC